MKFERFEDLPIWQTAREICKRVSVITSAGEFSTDFKLRDQIRGSSGSVMDIIAEGFDYNYISKDVCDEFVLKTLNLSQEIAGFINYLKGSGFRGEKYL
jgi:hypothetical protein